MNYKKSNKHGICFVLESFYPVVHGATTQTLLLGESLVKYGYNVSVITRQIRPGHPQYDYINNIAIRRVKPVVGLNRFGKYLMLGPALISLIKNKAKYDVIIVSDFKVLGVIGVIASKMLRKKCILRAASCGEMDGSYAYAFKDKKSINHFIVILIKLLISLRNPILRQTDRFLSITTVITKELLKCGVPKEKIIENKNGIDTQKYIPVKKDAKVKIRNKLGLPDARIFTYTGRITKGKGLTNLINVWGKIVKKYPETFLLLIGSGQGFALSSENKFEEMVYERKLENYVKFLGHVENIHEYLQSSDGFIFPTRYEALSNCLLEALSTGLPCIATRVGGNVDVISHGKNGLLIKNGDEKELYIAVEKVIQNKNMAEELGYQARLTAINDFDIKEKVKMLVNNITLLIER